MFESERMLKECSTLFLSHGRNLRPTIFAHVHLWVECLKVLPSTAFCASYARLSGCHAIGGYRATHDSTLR